MEKIEQKRNEMIQMSHKEFAIKIAKAMLKISSSHTYFILQQAFGENLDWSDAELLLKSIIGKAR